MAGKVGDLSPRKKLIAGCAAALVMIGAAALVALLAGAGGPSISDSASCDDFVRADPGEQSSYLESKLNDPTSVEEVAYAEGIRINCAKGYPNSTTLREFEATQSEIGEAESEGADLGEAIALIRQRAEERETYGEFIEESEGP